MRLAYGGVEIASRNHVDARLDSRRGRGRLGFDLERTLAEVPPVTAGRIVTVDGNASFWRPGLRVVEGVELLAHLLHADVWPSPGIPHRTVPATTPARS